MLKRLLFNETRDNRMILNEIRRSTTKQLYNQLMLAKEADNNKMASVFFDNFDDEEKTDDRTTAEYADDLYRIKQHKKTFDDNGYDVDFNGNLNVISHGSINCLYGENDGQITVLFLQDGEVKHEYNFEGENPHINHKDGTFYIAYEVEEDDYQQIEYRKINQFGLEDEGERVENNTSFDVLNPYIIFNENGVLFILYISRRNNEYNLYYKRESYTTRRLLSQDEVLDNIQGVLVDETLYVFYEDEKNGERQINFFDIDDERERERITENDKKETDYSLLVKDDEIHMFSLCTQNYYLDLLHTVIKDGEVKERKYITTETEDLDKGKGTLNDKGRFTYYTLRNEVLTVLYDEETFHIEYVEDFTVNAAEDQNLFITQEAVRGKTFDTLYLEEEVLHTHTPEFDSSVFSIDIEDAEEFESINLYVEGNGDLKIKPFINYKDVGEEFRELSFVKDRETEGGIEKHYSIATPPVKKINLRFELTVESREQEGDFLGYGITFI